MEVAMALKREDVLDKRSYGDKHFISVIGISRKGNGRLEDLDSEKLKTDIKKWARAVVANATQVPKDTKTLRFVEEAMALKRENVEREYSLHKVGRMDEKITVDENRKLEEFDSEKLKMQIKKWEKAAVAYSRQVSGHLLQSSG